MMRWMGLLALVGVLSCGTEEDGSLFGVGTQGSGTPTTDSTSGGGDSTGIPTTSISASGGDASGGDSNDDPTLAGSSGGDSGSTTTGMGSTSGSSSGAAESSSSSSTGAGEESSSSSSTSGAGDDDGGMMGGMQPGDGMYSPCEVPDDCGFAPELCITLSNMDGMLLDGFCSETTCNDPLADCDPSPGGTAPVACLDITVDGMPDSACVLDCSGGASCPTGMTCYDLGGISICG